MGRTHPHCDAGGSWGGPTPTVMLGQLREDPPPLQSWEILLGRTHTHCDAGVSRWGGPTPTAMLGVSGRTHLHCDAGASWGGPTPLRCWGSQRGPKPTAMLEHLREDPPPLRCWGVLGRTHPHCDAGGLREDPPPLQCWGVSGRTHPPVMLGVCGFSGCGSPAPGARASVAVACGLGCSAARGFFVDEGLNLCPLHWQVDSYPLCHQGSSNFCNI